MYLCLYSETETQLFVTAVHQSKTSVRLNIHTKTMTQQSKTSLAENSVTFYSVTETEQVFSAVVSQLDFSEYLTFYSETETQQNKTSQGEVSVNLKLYSETGTGYVWTPDIIQSETCVVFYSQ